MQQFCRLIAHLPRALSDRRKGDTRQIAGQFFVIDANHAYTNLNTHPAYSSFRKSRAQLRKADQEVTATAMIHKLKGYSTKGKSYNNYLFAMYQDNQRLIAAHM